MARRVILLGILLAMAVVSLNLGKCLSIYLCAIICVLFCFVIKYEAMEKKILKTY